MKLSIGLLGAVLMAGMSGIAGSPGQRDRTRYVPAPRDDDLHMRKADEKRQRRAAKNLQSRLRQVK